MTRVVQIDDDGQLRKAVGKMLRMSLGYEVTDYENPEDAVEAILEDPPDVVLTDLQMPQMSGIDVAEKVHHVTPVVILTGGALSSALQVALQDALSSTVSSKLTKPVNRTELDNALSTAMSEFRRSKPPAAAEGKSD